MSRAKDQSQGEPAVPPSSQTRTLGWTGYQMTVKELRSWLDQIPNHATITWGSVESFGEIHATWEVP